MPENRQCVKPGVKVAGFYAVHMSVCLCAEEEKRTRERSGECSVYLFGVNQDGEN